jgi:hypothetical protein
MFVTSTYLLSTKQSLCNNFNVYITNNSIDFFIVPNDSDARLQRVPTTSKHQTKRLTRIIYHIVQHLYYKIVFSYS